MADLPTRRKAVRLAQVEASLKLARTAVLGGLVNAAVVALALWNTVPGNDIVLWLFTIVGLAWLRLNHARGYLEEDRAQRDPSERAGIANIWRLPAHRRGLSRSDRPAWQRRRGVMVAPVQAAGAWRADCA